MGDTERTVSGLDPDDDGYLVKPIVKQELLARVRSIVRQAKPPRGVWVEYCYPMISLGLLTYDTSCRGEVVHMRPTECGLLTNLALNDNRVLSYQELPDKVWGNDVGSLDSLKWHVSALREKLETDPKKPNIIVTFPRMGYHYFRP